MPVARAATTAAVALENITIRRGGVPIIQDMTLTIPEGTVFGLVGPSGSGKTTLIRGLLGLSPVTDGRATVLGKPAGAADLRPSLGYMPQDAAVYPDLSGRENLDFFASIYRARPGRAQELIAMLDIEHVADRPVQTYSGGQRQRIALAAALIPDPRLMLLDEPTVGLDPRLRVRLWEAFRSLAADGATLVVSTHVMDEATRCDLVAFLSDGRLVAVGTPAELMERAGASDLETAVLAMTGAGPAVAREEVRRVG